MAIFGHSAHIPAVRHAFFLCCSSCSLALFLSACAGSQYPDIDEPLPPGTKTSTGAAPEPVASGAPVTRQAGTLQRGDVEKVVDAGLGRFLSQVAIEPKLQAGKFVGWSIVSLQPPELWRGIDLQPGDVVTRVNGMAIEREMQAYDAFQAVRQAPTLEVSYTRGGQPRLLRYAIIGPASLPPQPPARPAPAGGSAPTPAAPSPG